MNAIRKSLVTETATSILVGGGYFTTCWFGLSLGVTAGVSSMWPAAGLLTGLLTVTSRDRWRAIAAGTVIGGLAANLAFGFSAFVSLSYALINLGEGLTAALLVRRFAADAVHLRRPGDIIWFGALCAVAVLAGALLGATFAAVWVGADFWTALRTWAAADISGIITVGPVILVIARGGDTEKVWTIRRAAEGALMLALLALGSWWVFFAPHAPEQTALTQPFPLLPLAIWAAIRFGVPGTIGCLLVVTVSCLWGTSLGLGPYTAPDMLLAYMTVQVFGCAVSLLFLVLATSVESTQRSARLHRELALQLQSAADAERSRLAHELHDDIAQKLGALKIELELDRLLKAKGRASGDFVPSVDQLIDDVRALSLTLRPAPFEEGQLIPALATLARTEGRRAGLRVLVDARTNEVRLSRDAELACYRVVREAVANIIKHARAHHLAVSALTHANVFAVRIVDDGTGFDVAPATRQAVLDGHLGLMGMQERLSQVGGTLKIRSRRGGGTMVECRVPLIAAV